MDNDLSVDQLVDLFNYEIVISTEKLQKITKEIQQRSLDLTEIKDRFISGSIGSQEEMDLLILEAQDHLSRVEDLKEQAKLIMLDVRFDFQAIMRKSAEQVMRGIE